MKLGHSAKSSFQKLSKKQLDSNSLFSKLATCISDVVTIMSFSFRQPSKIFPEYCVDREIMVILNFT